VAIVVQVPFITTDVGPLFRSIGSITVADVLTQFLAISSYVSPVTIDVADVPATLNAILGKVVPVLVNVAAITPYIAAVVAQIPAVLVQVTLPESKHRAGQQQRSDQ